MLQFLLTHNETQTEELARYTRFFRSEGREVFFLKDITNNDSYFFKLPERDFKNGAIFVLCNSALHLYLDARVSMSKVNRNNYYVISKLLEQGVDFLIITESERMFDKRIRGMTKDISFYNEY